MQEKGKNMGKKIHVNSYVRKDGTQVKEHYRNIDAVESFLPEDDKEGRGGIIEENPWDKKKPGDVMYMDGVPVLEGYVEVLHMPDNIPLPGGNVLGTIASIAVTTVNTAIDISLKLCQAVDAMKPWITEQLKSKLSTTLEQIKTQHVELENLSKQYLDKLVNTKNPIEYKKLFKDYVAQKELLQNANDKLARINYAYEHDDFDMLYNELGQYKSYFDEVMNKTWKNAKLENLYLTDSKIPTQYNFDNIKPELKSAVQNKKYLDNIIGIAKNTGTVDDGAELWKAFAHDFTQSKDYIEKNGNLVYSIKNLPSKELQQMVYDKVMGQMHTSDALGVILSSNSSLSQNIAKSNEMKTFFKQNANKLLNGEMIKKSSTRFQLRNSPNLNSAIKNADILYSYIDQQGNWSSIVMDTYDFNAGEGGIVGRARTVQEAGLGRQYYSLIVVKIPISQWIKWLKQ